MSEAITIGTDIQILKLDDTTWIRQETLSKWFDEGWRIVRTSCSCGGNWAWGKNMSEDESYFKMYGCICHHIPDKDFC